MTAQKLYSILKFLETLDSKLKLQSFLDSINQNLEQLASQPAQPTYQTQLATALTSFTDAVDKMREALTPSQLGVIKDRGGEEFFALAIAAGGRTALEK